MFDLTKLPASKDFDKRLQTLQRFALSIRTHTTKRMVDKMILAGLATSQFQGTRLAKCIPSNYIRRKTNASWLNCPCRSICKRHKELCPILSN